MAAVETPDPRHVRFKLKEPWPDFLTFYATRHRRRLDRAEEVCREGRRRRLQEGADRRRPLQIRLVQPRASSWCSRPSTGIGARRPSVKRLVFKVIPDEATRLAALKRGEVDIVYSIRGELAEELRRTPGLTLKPAVVQGAVLALLPRPVGPEIAVARRAGAAGRQPGDRPQGHQPGADARLFARSPAASFPTPSSSTGSRRRRSTIRPRPSSCWPRRAIPTASTPASTTATPPTRISPRRCSTISGEVGIRAKLRPLERAAFFKGYAEKKFKNLIQGGSGAFGNAATRLEAFVVKGGTYVYGSYPDIDALFQQQAAELDHKKREAILHKMQQLVHERDDLRADLAARLHQRRRPAGRRIGLRPDPGLRLYRALRGHHASKAPERHAAPRRLAARASR